MLILCSDKQNDKTAKTTTTAKQEVSSDQESSSETATSDMITLDQPTIEEPITEEGKDASYIPNGTIPQLVIDVFLNDAPFIYVETDSSDNSIQVNDTKKTFDLNRSIVQTIWIM